MNILALETSTRECSIALAIGNNDPVACQVSTDGGPGKNVIPSIQSLLNLVGLQANEIQLIALNSGPGSFTGLRVGVTIAKSIAYAIQAEVIQYNSLLSCAIQATHYLATQPRIDLNSNLHVVMDAQRKQFFACEFSIGDLTACEDFGTLNPNVNIIDQESWCHSIHNGDWICGLGLTRINANQVSKSVNWVAEDYWIPNAGTLCSMARKSQRRDDFWSLTPQYYRLSAAEEKKHASGNSAC